MNNLLVDFSAFHFLRPLWLWLIPLIVLGWWWLRHGRRADTVVPRHMAPHLARALSVGERHSHWLRPIDSIAALLVLLVLGTAGPSWSRVPNPLMSRSAPLVLVLQVTASMEEKDVPPSRLARAKQKMFDLLKTRDGAPTALVAYAGSVHRVVPLTDDEALLRPYIEGLTPEIMPRSGDNASAALRMAEKILQEEKTPGSVLFFLDGLSTADAQAFSGRSDTTYGLGFLMMTPGNKPAPNVAQVSGAKAVEVTPDTSDIESLNRYFAAAYKNALLEDETQQWEDRGWWFAWPAALLALLWFRRGWVIQGHTLALLIILATALPRPVHAQSPNGASQSLANWLLTPDQQGQLLLYRKNYTAAAEAFQDPLHKGYALYMSSKNKEAATVLAEIQSPQAATLQGIAEIKDRQYRQAVRTFQRVLSMDPHYPGAQQNLETAQAIVEHVEKAQEEQTGEESVGADEERFDNEANKGEETEVEGAVETPVSAEQWMSTLNTRTEDFLRQRFAIEADSDSGSSQ